jgi:hypothetical protein
LRISFDKVEKGGGGGEKLLEERNAASATKQRQHAKRREVAEKEKEREREKEDKSLVSLSRYPLSSLWVLFLVCPPAAGEVADKHEQALTCP